MPRFDGTGPQGFGPVTGRGFGPCTGVNPGRFYGSCFGRRLGRGRFWGYGYGNGFGPGFGLGWGRSAFWGGASLPTEKEFLEQQRDLLKARLEEIAEELDEL
ncbi:MAG: DUF5320 domain-containing protein [Bacillota bacterium]|nr:DUF5320 domain-containing protein [Bacillota bacterium]HHT90094.1 DUF5320 domain-containing protein [Bacillota bacterium]